MLKRQPKFVHLIFIPCGCGGHGNLYRLYFNNCADILILWVRHILFCATNMILYDKYLSTNSTVQCTVGKHVVLGFSDFADHFLKVFKSADLCRIQNKKCRLDECNLSNFRSDVHIVVKQVRKSGFGL